MTSTAGEFHCDGSLTTFTECFDASTRGFGYKVRFLSQPPIMDASTLMWRLFAAPMVYGNTRLDNDACADSVVTDE